MRKKKRHNLKFVTWKTVFIFAEVVRRDAYLDLNGPLSIPRPGCKKLRQDFLQRVGIDV